MLGIVTVNWNGYEVTSKLVRQVVEFCPAPFHLAVINNSPDEQPRFDADPLYRSPGIRLIHSSTNTGYAGGLNLGIQHLLPIEEITEFLLMNNDVELPEDFFRQLFDKGTSEDTIYAPLILLRDTDLVQNTGGKLVIWLGGTININKNVPLKNIRRQQPDFLSGCVLFLRRSVIKKIGLFDETFGSYYEDVDYCLRAASAGIRLEILWDVPVRHFHSHSTKGNSSYKIYLLNRNQILFARKSLPGIKRELFITAAIFRGFAQNLLSRNLDPFFRGVKEGLRR